MQTFVPFTCDEQVELIGSSFLSLTLPKSSWTHAAHFATALWLLSCHPELELDVPAAMPNMIRAYNEATGVANTDTSGYHETITQASIRAARAFLSHRPTNSLFVTCNDLMSSPLGRTDWILSYWSRERLFCAEARRTWVEPDLGPIPF